MTRSHSEIVVIGGGHNGLVAATYLARAGHEVRVFEARNELGGAVASSEVFEGVAARLSRFSYLVSLLPTSVIDELGLRVELRSRRSGLTRRSDRVACSSSVRKDVSHARRSGR